MKIDAYASPQRMAGAVIHQPSGSEARWIVETPDGRTIRLGAQVGKLYDCLDGASSTDVLAQRMGEPWTAATVSAGIAKLRESGLIAEAGADNGRKAGRLRASSIASVQLTLLDHPSLFSGCRPWTTVVASRWSVAAGLSLGMAGLVALLANAQQVMYDLSSPVAPLTSVLLVVLMVFLTSLHEFGHAVALARYGGVVRRIGVMLLYLSPAMFCDVSDAWRLPEKRQRVVVALAGGVVSFALAGGCAVLYAFSPTGSPLLAALAVASYAAVVFNLLPFVKFDGYIALMTHLDIPNLRRTAMDEWKRALLISVSGGDPGHRASKKRWVPWFGLGCSLMPLALLGSTAAQFGSLAAGLGPVGMFLRSVLWISIGAVVLRGAWRIHELSIDIGAPRWAWRGLLAAAAVCILGLSLIGVKDRVSTGYATLADGTSAVVVPSGWQAEDLADRPVTLLQAGLLWQVKVGEGATGSRGQYSSVPIRAMAPAFDYAGASQEVPTIPLHHVRASTSQVAVGVAKVHLGTTPMIVLVWRTIVAEPIRAMS